MLRASVIIPTYKRHELVSRCLHALLLQDFPADAFEVIIADDAASLETERLIRSIAASPANPRTVQVHYLPVKAEHGPAAARNAGWQMARGRVIAFTDDDTIPEPDWLKCGIELLEGHPSTVAAWGKVVVPMLNSIPTDYELDASRLAQAGFVTANCFCQKYALEEIGGFDTRFKAAWREDSDLYFRLLKRFPDMRDIPSITFLEQAIVVHPIRPASWGVSIKQQKKAMYNALLYKKHPELYLAKIQSSPPWHYYTMLSLLLLSAISLFTAYIYIAVAGLALWLVLTMRFCLKRLRYTSKSPLHISEMVFTSVVIPHWLFSGVFPAHFASGYCSSNVWTEKPYIFSGTGKRN